MQHPLAYIHMENGAVIRMELLPESAPNTVASFLYCASHGWLDHTQIQRIVPGNWVDVSYTAFGKEECKYLIPNEFELNPHITPLPSHPGCVCMGGYGSAGLAGCEYFFPLRDCPEHLGIYPVFGKVTGGFEEILRISRVQTYPVVLPSCPEVEINTPVLPERIDRVALELRGYEIHEPIKMERQQIPGNW